MDREQKFELIRNTLFFRQWDPVKILNILPHLEVKHYIRQRYLYYQGDRADSTFYLMEGKVKVEKFSGEKSLTLGHFSQQKWLGLAETLEGEQYLHNCQVIQDSSVLIVNRIVLVEICRDVVQQRSFLQAVLNDYRILDHCLHLDNPEVRIGKYLLALQQQYQTREIIITQDAIADSLDFTRETINKHLKYLEARGLLRIQRGKIILLNLPGLESLIKS